MKAFDDRTARLRLAGGCAAVALSTTLLVVAAETASRVDRAMLLASPAAADQTAEDVVVGQVTPTNDEFNDMLRNPAFWAARRQGKPFTPSFTPFSAPAFTPKANLGGPADPAPQANDVVPKERMRIVANTYRTVCVRLCDGSFFPVSFSTTRDRFSDDADTCASTCTAGGARLFVHRNPGEDAEAMEDLNGNPYRDLPTAFLYKTKYDPSCKCRPHPWEEASRDQHRIYALETQRAKGNRAVADELKQLRDKQKAAELQTKAQRRAEQLEKTARRKAANAGSKTTTARPIATNAIAKEPAVVTVDRGITTAAVTPGPALAANAQSTFARSP
jgi:hypothetical protein